MRILPKKQRIIKKPFKSHPKQFCQSNYSPKSLKHLIDNTLKHFQNPSPVTSLLSLLSKCQTSFFFFNSGFSLLARIHLDIDIPMKLPETLPLLNQLQVYQNLAILNHKLELDRNANYFIEKSVELLDLNSVLGRVEFLSSVIFMKLGQKKYEAASFYCEMCFKNTIQLDPGDFRVIQIHLFYVSCLKGLNKIRPALNELLRCVEMLMSFDEYRKSSYVKIVFLSLTDVYLCLEENENAIQALLDGGKILKNLNEKKELLDYYKEGWELVDYLDNTEQIKLNMEEVNEELYGNSIEAVDLYLLLSKITSLNGNIHEAIKYRKKILNIYKMNNKVNLYFDSYSFLANLYLRVDPKTAETYIKVCENLVKTHQKFSSDHLVKLMWYNFYKATNNQQKASEYFQLYLESFPDNTKPSNLIENYFGYGEFTGSRLDFSKSLQSYNSALSLNETSKQKKLDTKFEIFEAIGLLYRNKKDFEKSLEYLSQSLEYRTAKQGVHSSKLKKVNHEMMVTYMSMNEFHLALYYGEEVLKLIESENDSELFNSAVIYFNIGFIHQKLLDRPKAREFYSKSKKIFLQLQEFYEVELINENLKDVS